MPGVLTSSRDAVYFFGFNNDTVTNTLYQLDY